MNCEWVKSNITMFVYDELADDSRFELEQHVARCAECAQELKAVRGFRDLMSTVEQPEPSPNLLAASRMKLQESLETAEQQRGFRLFLDPTSWLRQMKFSPALAAALVIIGFAGGIGTAWKMVPSQTLATVTDNKNIAESSIAGIRQISQIPGTDKVEINYDTTVPQKAEGSMNDARIQKLLLYAARSNYNPGVREDAVSQLASKPDDSRIREALKSSLLYDTNPGVRLKSLDALGPYVKDDTSVRDAVLAALQTDQNPGVRAEAIHLLQPVRADGSVRLVVQRLAAEDKSDFIRKQCNRMLASMPDIY
jgi:HEAT repeats/Putative zinc-finger